MGMHPYKGPGLESISRIVMMILISPALHHNHGTLLTRDLAQPFSVLYLTRLFSISISAGT